MKHFKYLILFLFLYCSSSFAFTDNYLCNLNDKLKNKSSEKILDVGIRKVFSDKVEIYIIGFGAPVKAKFNGIPLESDRILKRRTIKCSNGNIGQIRIYDLRNIEEVGYFSIESSTKSAGTYIEVGPEKKFFDITKD